MDGLLQGTVIGAGFSVLYFLIQLWYKYRVNRAELTAKVGLQTKTDYDYLTRKYQEIISKLESQMQVVIVRLDVAEKTHKDALVSLEKEHQKCIVESARQEERLDVQKERIVSLETRIKQLETKGGQ